VHAYAWMHSFALRAHCLKQSYMSILWHLLLLYVLLVPWYIVTIPAPEKKKMIAQGNFKLSKPPSLRSLPLLLVQRFSVCSLYNKYNDELSTDILGAFDEDEL
jgi:hypothetical protein